MQMNKFLNQEEIQKLAETWSESTAQESERSDMSSDDEGELFNLGDKDIEDWVPDRSYKWDELVNLNTMKRYAYHNFVLKDDKAVYEDITV